MLLSATIAACMLWCVFRVAKLSYNPSNKSDDCRSVFLIRDGRVVDHSDSSTDQLRTWHDLRKWLGDRFGELPNELNQADGHSPQTRQAFDKQDNAKLTIQLGHKGHHVTLEDACAKTPAEMHELMVQNQRGSEFQDVLERAPAVVFAIDGTGDLRWANAKFDQMTAENRHLFLNAGRDSSGTVPVSLSLDVGPSKERQHFELSVLDYDSHTVFFAENVTKRVEAEGVRHTFVQTLTKTFADLSAGLAVFDRNHQLVLFNPALVDLTDLPAEFLSTRPYMVEFFDRLRDQQVMPEPKSYATWRAQIADIIQSAANGHHSESWTLPNGMTYKLTGRPHPNGAIAFLVEDISDEMQLTRRSRSQLETHQAILDAMPEAVAVFCQDGGLIVCNRPFVQLSGIDPDIGLKRNSLGDVMSKFQRTFPTSSIWKDIEREAAMGQPIDAKVMELFDTSGNAVSVQSEPLPEGLFMLRLSIFNAKVPIDA